MQLSGYSEALRPAPCAYSAGMTHVRGKKLYSFGKCFRMRVKFLPSRSLRQISAIPGKWLIF